jgi:hypothetical protein
MEAELICIISTAICIQTEAVLNFAVYNILCCLLVGTSRWGEFGEGGLLWGECSGKSFEWFDGSPTEELLCKVCHGCILLSF